jgi:peptide/nickel transport system substrate-binding protein
MRRRALLQAAALAPLVPLARPAVAQDMRAKTLRFIPQANLTSLDPIWTTATVTTNHGYYIYDTLFSVDGRMQPQPQMAEGAEVSPDQLTWTIRLREGLRFHDNTPVRSADCVASLARFAKKDAFGQIFATRLDGFATPDDRTLQIRLTRPFPLMLDMLAKPDANVPFIMPERLARTDPGTAITEMIGSGPYRFLASEYNSGSFVAYAKFDGYVPRQEKPDWGSGGKVAHYERVEWHVITDPATSGAALRNGEVDWWENPIADLLPQLRADPSLATQILNPTGLLAIMRLNNLQPPFDDVKLRRVVMMAANQQDYMQAVYGDAKDLWRSCYSLFPCGTPYETEGGSELLSGTHDPAAVKAALQAAGYAGQKVVILNPTDFPTIGPLGQVTYAALKQIGMNADLQESDWGTVIQRRGSREPTDRGGWSIFHTWGSGAAYINPAVSTIVRGLGAAGWFGWYSDPAIEQMVGQWLDAPDQDSRKRLADAIGAEAMRNVATIPLGQAFAPTTYRRTITGVLQGNGPYPWNVRPA